MSEDIKKLRKRFFVDSKVQGALIGRIVLYWVTCLISIALLLLCWQIMTSPPRIFYTLFSDMWSFFGPAAIASFLLLPLVAMDVIRISNRFVGPLLRLRRSMRTLAHGEDVEPIEFRDTDFWRDFADEFNAIRARILQLQDHAQSKNENEELLGV